MLDALADLKNIDAWVIDDDHNWYTAYHEFLAINAICRRDNKPLLASFHGIAWPFGRRDMYYSPDRIPPQSRYNYEGGVMQGASASNAVARQSNPAVSDTPSIAKISAADNASAS
jgi:hypothetical protein